MAGHELPGPADTDFGIDAVRGKAPLPSPLGAGAPRPDPGILHAQGFDLLGTLRPDPQDGLADFLVLREPSPFEAPR